MELVKEYKDFKIHFLFAKDVLMYFRNRGVKIENMFDDKLMWFELILFELIDDDGDGLPDEKIYGKEFRVVFYGIIEKYDKNGKPVGFELPHNNLENELIEDNLVLNIESKFFAKYAVIRKRLAA